MPYSLFFIYLSLFFKFFSFFFFLVLAFLCLFFFFDYFLHSRFVSSFLLFSSFTLYFQNLFLQFFFFCFFLFYIQQSVLLEKIGIQCSIINKTKIRFFCGTLEFQIYLVVVINVFYWERKSLGTSFFQKYSASCWIYYFLIFYIMYT